MTFCIRPSGALGLLTPLLLALPAPLRAQCTLAEIQRADQKLGTLFGEAVAVAGQTLVGASRIDHTLHVFAYESGAFVPSQILTGAGGFALDLSEAFLVSGDPFSGDSNQGRVLVYTPGSQGWELSQTLIVEAAPAGYAFGYSLALDGTRLAVGAIGDNVGAPGVGAVHLFEHDGVAFIHKQKLNATPTFEFDRFGSSVSLEDATMVVGAPEQDLPGFNSGAAYVFESQGGVFTQTAWLEAPDGAQDGVFGTRVSLSGPWLAVTAPGSLYPTHPSKGAVYLFQRDTAAFAFHQKLEPPPGTDNGTFGRDASFTPAGDRLAILSTRSQFGAPGCGAAYLLQYTPSGFAYADVAYAIDGNPLNGFGVQGLDLSNNLLLIGARSDSDLGSPHGSIYAYTLRTGGGKLYYGESTPGSGGWEPELALSGCPTLQQSAQFLVSKGLGGATGALLFGTQSVDLPLLGATLLVVPEFPPLWHQLSGQSGVPGIGATELVLGVPSNPSLVGLALYFQALYADAGASQGLSSTQGLRITLEQHLLGL